MVKPIVKDIFFLSQKSEPATPSDIQVGIDLQDTLKANRVCCVGLAANMIGVHKRIICFDDNGKYMTMFNPEIIKKSDPYQTEEGCLSLLGGPRPCKRYKSIKVQWQTAEFQTRIKTFTGWTAQIIQHEIDHCDGVLI
jgi:peptide deformylase